MTLMSTTESQGRTSSDEDPSDRSRRHPRHKPGIRKDGNATGAVTDRNRSKDIKPMDILHIGKTA